MIKSVEIFPQLSGPFESVEQYPTELFNLVKDYIVLNKITIRIAANEEFLNEVFALCDKYNIRCQRYLV